MNVENALAYQFILQEDIYLLNSEQTVYSMPAAAPIESKLAEPEPEYQAVATAATNEPESLAVVFDYLGGHKKNFLVMVHYPDHPVMQDKHLAALESTLARLGFSRDDVAVFNRANYPHATYEVLTAYFKPQKMLFLGGDSLPAGIDTLQLNKPEQLNGSPALFTFSFDEMMDSVENKKAFWEQMKLL